jgi:hypothetical protein
MQPVLSIVCGTLLLYVNLQSVFQGGLDLSMFGVQWSSIFGGVFDEGTSSKNAYIGIFTMNADDCPFFMISHLHVFVFRQEVDRFNQ